LRIIVLSHVFVAFVLTIILGLGQCYAAIPSNKTSLPRETHAIVGEVDDNLPSEEDETSSQNADGPINPHQTLKAQIPGNGVQVKKVIHNSQPKIAHKRRAKLLEGFARAEDFHKVWFHLPTTKVKSSLEKLTRFCKIACTSNQCADDEIANNCHLICPESTTQNCPDPLKKINSLKQMEDEISIPPSDASDPISPSITHSIKQAEMAISEGEE
jgi:hypothetical protein